MISPDQKLDDWPWGGPGRDLDELPALAHPWKRVVACLNVWNDLEELKRSLPLWIDHVDHIIALDGAYEGTATDLQSTDGTLAYLLNVEKADVQFAGGLTQPAKRSRFFDFGQPGDLFWIIDADEYVTGAECLRSTPYLDVGWVRYASPLYRRPQHQPRLFRWQPGLKYAGRHHWVHIGDQLAASHQQGGNGLIHRVVPLGFLNSRGALRPEPRKYQSEVRRIKQVKQEDTVGRVVEAHEPLRIFQMAAYDAGGVVSRLHSAINTTSPHESAMAVPPGHPFGYPKQHDIVAERMLCRDLAATADVIHTHVTYGWWENLKADGVRLDGKFNVMHHHGTELRKFHKDLYNQIDPERVKLRLVSNLELLQYGENLTYLPNPVPVGRYRALRARAEVPDMKDGFRVGHSPSKRELKGTTEFLNACERLTARGLKIVPVLIEGRSIRESLELKATCHAFFDSFWLGMQCSGLEAAAMGLPVIAGDPVCRREYWARGGVPYTYANDEGQLAASIVQLVQEPDFHEQEASRVSTYVGQVHDGASVVVLYLDLLDAAFHWREHLRLKAA